MSLITPEKLLKAGLVINELRAHAISPPLNDACSRYDINTRDRVIGFLAQCAHESDRFRLTVENMNYNVAGLLNYHHRYFNSISAKEYAHQPEKIANYVYANRLGNGPPESGDGYRFRGRGYIQITGRENYEAFSKSIGEDLVNEPDRLCEPVMAALSAAWFWQTHGLNELADKRDVIAMTRRVNGGLNGLSMRQKYYSKADAVF